MNQESTKSPLLSENVNCSFNEFSARKFLHFFFWSLGGGFFGILCSIAFLFFYNPQFEASAVVQPATIGSRLSSANTDFINRVPVEPPTQTLERLKISSFYSDEIVSVCGASSSSSLIDKIKSRFVKGSSLILIKTRAESKSLANDCLKRIIAELSTNQDILLKPLLDGLNVQLRLTEKQISEIQTFLSLYDTNLTNKSSNGSSDMQSLMYLNVVSKRDELLRLTIYLNEQTNLLSPPYTQPLKSIEKIYVSDQPVFPNKPLVFFIGFFTGLALGLLSFLAKNIFHRFKNPL